MSSERKVIATLYYSVALVLGCVLLGDLLARWAS